MGVVVVGVVVVLVDGDSRLEVDFFLVFFLVLDGTVKFDEDEAEGAGGGASPPPKAASFCSSEDRSIMFQLLPPGPGSLSAIT